MYLVVARLLLLRVVVARTAGAAALLRERARACGEALAPRHVVVMRCHAIVMRCHAIVMRCHAIEALAPRHVVVMRRHAIVMQCHAIEALAP